MGEHTDIPDAWADEWQPPADSEEEVEVKGKAGKMEITAYPGEDNLGFSYANPTKGPVLVKKVLPSGWAALHDVEVGLEMISVDGKNPSKMTKEELDKRMQKRPLVLVFRKEKKKKKKEDP